MSAGTSRKRTGACMTARVIVLELGPGVELAEALEALGRTYPLKGTGTAVHAAIEDTAEGVLTLVRGGQSWPPPHLHK